MTRDHKILAKRIADWIAEGRIIREGLAREGQSLIAKITRHISLRELARRTGLSHVYLSQVANGHVVISPGVFVAIATMAEEEIPW